MTASELITQATLDSRASWEALMEIKLKELYDLFQMSSDNIIAELNRLSIDGKIPPYRLKALYNNIQSEMQALRIAMNRKVKSMMSRSINAGIEDQILTLDKLKLKDLFTGKANLGTSSMNADGSISKYNRELSTYVESMWGQINTNAMEFLMRYEFSGEMLSTKIWNITRNAERALRQSISMAVLEGRSSAELSRSIRGFLNEPNRLYRRVTKDGRLVLSNAAKGYHPGQGVYRSSYKNAMRLARTEINRAYTEGALRYGATKPWIDGYYWRVGSGNPCPICSDANGQFYLKSEATGIPSHPHCYDEQTELYTSDGWKFFKDLNGNEKILSLNPKTFDLKWQKKWENIVADYDGEMVNFNSMNLSLSVTPDHNMFVGKRSDAKDRKFKSFRMVRADKIIKDDDLYRSSKWIGKKQEYIQIGDKQIESKLFCKFMGWWLSEGCVTKRKGYNCWQIVISQFKHVEQLKNDLSELSEHYKLNWFDGGLRIYDKDLGKYLEQFGKSYQKFIPDEIKGLSPNYLKAFLEAYNLGDGSMRKPKDYKGGDFKVEKTYYTTSKRLADDLGELMLKIGHHPSFYLQKSKGVTTKHKNGEYTSNHDVWRIRECYSQHASTYKITKSQYKGKIYDVALPEFHTLYIRRNGKVVWSGNCMCYWEMHIAEEKLIPLKDAA